MSLITAANLAKSFGPVDIFANVSLSVPQRARAAIVGPNGIGKTTLLRILIGLDTPSDGQVQRARGLSIGYLPQEARLDAEHSLWQECLRAFEELIAQEGELAQLERQMSDPLQAEAALERYGALQTKFEYRGGYSYPTRIRQVLTGLGFTESEFEMPLNKLSGGERTRAVLARLLLSNPQLLVLDEPTNHLDIAAVEWLEGYLSQWEGAAVIVSHDRYFLDKVCNTIWEMRRDGLETYRGNYTAYLQQRQERWELRKRNFESEIERLEKELNYIRRNISGQNVLQAKGKLKRLSRQIQAIEQAGMEAVLSKSWLQVSEDVNITTSPMSVDEAERRLHGLRVPDNRPLQLHLKLRAGGRSGNLVIRTRDLLVGYPGNPLFTAPDLELRRLECAALIGPNGAGKSTFLKTILEFIPPLQGEVILGASLEIGYFAQAHEGLDEKRTLMEEIESVAPHLLPGEVRSYLGRFLFSGDDAFKKVGVLSGGERGRLALAKLALQDYNLLLLDEPTNHLDIPSQEVLQSVLADYQGTVLLVSHDRYLIDALATQIWEVDVHQSGLVVYQGSYSAYKAEQEAQKNLEAQGEKGRQAEAPSAKVEFAQKSRQRNKSQAEERRRQQRLTEVETRIAELEKQLQLLARKLENPPSDPVKVQHLGQDYVAAQHAVEALMAEWEELHE